MQAVSRSHASSGDFVVTITQVAFARRRGQTVKTHQAPVGFCWLAPYPSLFQSMPIISSDGSRQSQAPLRSRSLPSPHPDPARPLTLLYDSLIFQFLFL